MPRFLSYLLAIIAGLVAGPIVATFLWMNPVAAVLAMYAAGVVLFLLSVDAVLSSEGIRGFFRDAEEAGRHVAVLLLSFALGLHWAVLQSVAWTSMFVQRVQSASVTEALRTTFDGKHPCRLCQVVREGRAAERQSPAAPNTASPVTPRLEATLGSTPLPLVFEAQASVIHAAPASSFRIRSQPPPLPPPRLV